MLKTTASRLAAFAAGLALAAGSAAAIGAATGATPPFQDCLKVAAANAGFGNQTMSDAGHGAAPMIEAVPGSDGLHAQARGPPARSALADADRRRDARPGGSGSSAATATRSVTSTARTPSCCT